ncbi:MAG TPA: peptidyl-prolyl cis-trans isomerase [Phycisphaerae bacterium]|nr:peptidyl-prolyl cis-trans isomerase [Phycisphaerae bacterium]HRW55360.1 peptidyl-prolyl cis-trans isomerase [Phycisphaerae bacterium]
MTRTLLACTIGAACVFGCGDSNWNLFGASGGDSKNAAVDDALADYNARMRNESRSRKRFEVSDGSSPQSDTAAADAPIPESDTLEVLDQYITIGDVLDPIRPRLEEMASSMPPRRYYESAAELVRASLVELVATHLIYQRAVNELPDNFEPRIVKAIDQLERERISREFEGLETKYENHLAAHGESREKIREKLRRVVIGESYLREQLVPLIAEPRREEIEHYYRDHKSDFTTEQRRELLMIDVPAATFLDRNSPMQREQQVALAMQRAKNTIADARRELDSGVPFDAVARKYSKFKQNDGGNWGFIREPLASRWEVPSRRFFELAPGQVSEIIETEDSFFIVKCGNVEGGVTTPFAEAQPMIVRDIKNARFRKLKSEFLQKELRKANIGAIEPFFRRALRQAPQPRYAGR